MEDGFITRTITINYFLSKYTRFTYTVLTMDCVYEHFILFCPVHHNMHVIHCNNHLTAQSLAAHKSHFACWFTSSLKPVQTTLHRSSNCFSDLLHGSIIPQELQDLVTQFRSWSKLPSINICSILSSLQAARWLAGSACISTPHVHSSTILWITFICTRYLISNRKK
jgi:hypothetical protein